MQTSFFLLILQGRRSTRCLQVMFYVIYHLMYLNEYYYDFAWFSYMILFRAFSHFHKTTISQTHPFSANHQFYAEAKLKINIWYKISSFHGLCTVAWAIWGEYSTCKNICVCVVGSLVFNYAWTWLGCFMYKWFGWLVICSIFRPFGFCYI